MNEQQLEYNGQMIEVDTVLVVKLLKQKAIIENNELLQTQIESCFWQAGHMELTQKFDLLTDEHEEAMMKLSQHILTKEASEKA